MPTIINKIIFGLLFSFLSWKGLDGLFVNYFSNDIYDIDIRHYVNNGDRSQRYLKIRNGIGIPQFLYYESSDFSNIDVIYPVVSHTQFAKLQRGEVINVFVLVKRVEISRIGDYLLPDSTELFFRKASSVKEYWNIITEKENT